MSLSPGLEAEKALRIDNQIRAEFYRRLDHALMWCFEQKIKRKKGVKDIIIKVECKNCEWIGQAIVGRKGFPLERYRCPVCGRDLRRAKGRYNYHSESAVLKK